MARPIRDRSAGPGIGPLSRFGGLVGGGRGGAKAIGPLVVDILNDRERSDDEELEQSLLEDLADETLANERAIARKDLLLARAVTLLVLAIVFELAGVS